MIIYTLSRKPENPTRGGTTEGREADEALVELRAEIGASPLAREIRSAARLEAFEDPQFSDFCQKYQVTEENAKKALINLLHVLGQLGSLILEGPGGSLEVNLMVCYTLRDPTRIPPVTDLSLHPVEVNANVGLKALSGSGASLVEEIRSIARLETFDLPEIGLFCQNYQVTDKQALRNLLQDLKEKDLILKDLDSDGPRMVRKLEGSEFS